MQNSSIMWIVGGQGTGKTTMKKFIDNLYSECETFDFGDGDNTKLLAYDAIDLILNNDEDAPTDIIIFSQELPPQFVNGKPFNPILMKLDRVEPKKSEIAAFFDTHFERGLVANDSECMTEFNEIRKYINKLSPPFSWEDINNYLNDNYDHVKARKPYEMIQRWFYAIKIKSDISTREPIKDFIDRHFEPTFEGYTEGSMTKTAILNYIEEHFANECQFTKVEILRYLQTLPFVIRYYTDLKFSKRLVLLKPKENYIW